MCVWDDGYDGDQRLVHKKAYQQNPSIILIHLIYYIKNTMTKANGKNVLMLYNNKYIESIITLNIST